MAQGKDMGVLVEEAHSAEEVVFRLGLRGRFGGGAASAGELTLVV